MPDDDAARTGVAASATPGAWDTPWHRKEDAIGWETVYRGKGQPRPVRSVIEIELTAEQDEWLDQAAEVAGCTPHEILRQLIDTARHHAGDSQSMRGPASVSG